MISENAEWVDGALSAKMDAATANANKQGVSSNLERLEKLIQKSTVSKEESAKILKRVNEVHQKHSRFRRRYSKTSRGNSS